ncbi:MAG: hypothetical protein AAF579_06925 [Cyanobacteria bacterium P01_C01_bin.118]
MPTSEKWVNSSALAKTSIDCCYAIEIGFNLPLIHPPIEPFYILNNPSIPVFLAIPFKSVVLNVLSSALSLITSGNGSGSR